MSRELALFHGIAYGNAEPPTTMATSKLQLFALLVLSHRPSSSQTIYFVAATCTSTDPFVTATDGASVCACVPCFLSSNEIGT